MNGGNLQKVGAWRLQSSNSLRAHDPISIGRPARCAGAGGGSAEGRQRLGFGTAQNSKAIKLCHLTWLFVQWDRRGQCIPPGSTCWTWAHVRARERESDRDREGEETLVSCHSVDMNSSPTSIPAHSSESTRRSDGLCGRQLKLLVFNFQACPPLPPWLCSYPA